MACARSCAPRDGFECRNRTDADDLVRIHAAFAAAGGLISEQPTWPDREALPAGLAYSRAQLPATGLIAWTRNSGSGAAPVPAGPASAAATAAREGSIAPACAATFGVGYRPPLITSFGGAPAISTRLPRNSRTSLPVRRYVPDSSDIVY